MALILHKFTDAKLQLTVNSRITPYIKPNMGGEEVILPLPLLFVP